MTCWLHLHSWWFPAREEEEEHHVSKSVEEDFNTKQPREIYKKTRMEAHINEKCNKLNYSSASSDAE